MDIGIIDDLVVMVVTEEELLEFRGSKARDGTIYADHFGNDLWFIIINTKEKYDVVKKLSKEKNLPFTYLDDDELGSLIDGSKVIELGNFFGYRLAIGTKVGLEKMGVSFDRRLELIEPTF